LEINRNLARKPFLLSSLSLEAPALIAVDEKRPPLPNLSSNEEREMAPLFRTMNPQNFSGMKPWGSGVRDATPRICNSGTHYFFSGLVAFAAY
jgi:hypothetical protein